MTQAEAVLSTLRARGLRVTRPRRAIVAALVEAGPHLTAEALHERVRSVDPSVSEATVYRALAALEAAGAVEHVHLGHGPAIYHLADEDHLHLVCRGCGVTIEERRALLDGVAARVKRRHGFVLDAGHFAITGYCRACRGSTRSG